jgi:hypothetical protein
MNEPIGEATHDDKVKTSAWVRPCYWPRLACCIALACAFAFASHAALAYPGEGVLDVPIGTATRQALELQRGGAQSSPAQPMSGEQAGLAYDRYMKSFSNPIPEFFNSSLKTSSDAGSTGSQ